jgi:tRNA threonylcarbamoyladenosine biosynthesis protein TsaB
MSNILALDTSSDNCSVALWRDQNMFQLCEKAPRSHTQLILPMVEECLAKGNLKVKDLDAVAFGCGPGSFTGIRIATGVAQGLAYGGDTAIHAISNIQAMALQSYLKNKSPHVMVAIDARMDEVYWACCRVVEEDGQEGAVLYQVETYDVEKVTKPEEVYLPAEIGSEPVVGVGSGFDYMERFPSSTIERLSSIDATLRPEADAICELARTEVSNGQAGMLEDAMPSYVRNTVTWKKLPGRE